MELDMRDKSPQVSAKDGSALPKNPLQDARVREAIDLSIDRPALARDRDGGPGQPQPTAGDARHLRLQPEHPDP
jgi:peptide/nickel transport system substrate-binding protein